MQSSSVERAVLLVAFLIAAPAVHAQTVDELVDKNIQAKGGFEVLKNTNSVRTTGKGTMQGAEVTAMTVSKRPFYVRNEMGVAGQKMTVGFDGTTAWLAAGTMPAQPLPPGPQTEGLKRNSQIDSPLFDYKAKGTKIELGEPLKEGDRTLHHLIVTPKGSPAMHYYLDPVTGLEAKMVIDTEDAGQKIKMELRFSDFKPVAGRTVPFTVEQYVNGAQVMTMTFQSIEFNIPVDDALFRMPK